MPVGAAGVEPVEHRGWSMAAAVSSRRGAGAASRLRSRWSATVGRLASRPATRWLTTFTLVALLGGLWTAATPLLSGPDEGPATTVSSSRDVDP